MDYSTTKQATTPEVDIFAKAATLIAEAGKAVSITDDQAEGLATDAIRQMSKLHKDIDAQRTESLAPLKERTAKIQGEFNAYLTPLKEAERYLRDLVMTYQRQKLAKAQAEERRLEAERQRRQMLEAQKAEEEAAQKRAEADAARVGGYTDQARVLENQAQAKKVEADAVLDAAVEAPPIKIAVPAASGSMSTGRVSGRWTHEITNEELVPRKYLKVDPDAIKLAIKNQVRDIPGIRIYQKSILSVGA